jgi:hypothetical protein
MSTSGGGASATGGIQDESKRSAVYQYFTQQPRPAEWKKGQPDKYKCAISRRCASYYSAGAALGTSALFKHLKNKHPPQHKLAQQASNASKAAQQKKAESMALATGVQPTLDGTYLISTSSRQRHNRHFGIASVVDLLPCCAIKNDGMRLLLGGFCPGYTAQVIGLKLTTESSTTRAAVCSCQ